MLRLIRFRPLACFSLLFGLGVSIGCLLMPPVLPLLIAGGIAGLSALILNRGKARSTGITALIWLFAVLCCASGYASARVSIRPVTSEAWHADFTGRISGDAYTDRDGTRLVCEIRDFTVNGTRLNAGYRLYLRGEAVQIGSLEVGQVISGTGNLSVPDRPTNPHESDFGAILWQNRLSGYLTAQYEDITREGIRGGSDRTRFLIRRAISARIDRLFPQSASLVNALILGEKRGLDESLRSDFADAGVAHLLAISGMHVTMLAAVVSFLLSRFLKRKYADPITCVLLFLYGTLVGFSPSVLRACIMFTVLRISPLGGRGSDPSTRLLFAFALILMIDPADLKNTGFQLSFLACAGLIWIGPVIGDLLRSGRTRASRSLPIRVSGRVLDALITTFSAQAATYPAVAAYYGSFSLASFAANPFLVPLCMCALALAYIGLLVPPIARCADLLFRVMCGAVRFCASLPASAVSVPKPGLWVWIGFPAALFLISPLSMIPRKVRYRILPVLPLLVVLSLIPPKADGITAAFLDVAEADSCVISEGTHACVIDLGSGGREAADQITGERLNTEALFLTHPHSDHAGGISYFLTEHMPGTVYLSPGWEENISSDSFREEWEAVRDRLNLVTLYPGDTVPFGNGIFRVMGTDRQTDDPVNDSSLILRYEYEGRSILLTGDANAGDCGAADILKVSHHGDAQCTDETVVSSVHPEIAVISTGKNSYGHPAQKVLELLDQYGAAVYRTDQCGAVTVRIRRNGEIKVNTYFGGEQDWQK